MVLQAEVYYAGREIGTIDWSPDAYGVQIALDCETPACGGALLRCYAQAGEKQLRIGLPEPQCGRLVLRRRLSREMLRDAGCLTAVPDRFYLAAEPENTAAGEEPVQPELPRETALRTGDAVLDALLACGAVQAEPAGDALVLHCAFASDRPFALAPAFVLCTVEEGVARLRWTKKDAADGAASNAHTD